MFVDQSLDIFDMFFIGRKTHTALATRFTPEAFMSQTAKASGDDAGGDEGSGLGAVDGFDEVGCGGFTCGFDIDGLTADHAGGKRAVGAYAGPDGEGDIAEDGDSG